MSLVCLPEGHLNPPHVGRAGVVVMVVSGVVFAGVYVGPGVVVMVDTGVVGAGVYVGAGVVVRVVGISSQHILALHPVRLQTGAGITTSIPWGHLNL